MADTRLPFDAVSDRLLSSLEELYEGDRDLVTNRANERTITARLAALLQSRFAGWHVDAEYNREGVSTKRLREHCDQSVIYPDVIVHRRGREGPNLLVVEVKPAARRNRGDDICKLKAMTLPHSLGGFGYEWGAFVVLQPETWEVRWFHNGEELPL